MVERSVGNPGTSRRTLIRLVAISVVVTGCRSPAADTSPTSSLDSTVDAFQSFSGMTVPATASEVTVRVVADEQGPGYLVGFDLPTGQVDQFCRDGQLSRPLHVVTIPDDYRETFGYQGDSSPGIRLGSGGLPANLAIQREVFVVGTLGSVSHVQIHSFAIGR